MISFTVISAVVAFIFFSMGWTMAQRAFTWAKLMVRISAICTPFTVIWWILVLIDWPADIIMRLLYPFVVLWLPFFAGNLIHQFLYLVSKQADD
jgi:hypothetical protein